MKHSVRTLTLILSILFSLSAFADGGKCGNNVKWELTKFGHLTISGTGTMKDYGYDDAPWLPDMVTSVEIEDGITYIGRNAFAKTRIMSVTIPASVEIIGDKAFKNCKSLSKVDFAYGIKTIGQSAFSGCQALSKLTVPGSVRQIGSDAFEGCKTLSQVTIPSRVDQIGENAFKNCKALTTINELPDYISESNAKFFGFSYAAVHGYLINRTSVAQTSTVTPKSQEKPKETPARTSVAPARTVPAVAYGNSDIDTTIPVRPQNNSNTFAVIIANEHYSNLASVPFAINDGTSFAKYCTSTLGLPEQNISFYQDATYGNVHEGLSWLRDIDDAFSGDINVIFYYAGHGVPDDATNDAFIVPVDAPAKPTRNVCFPLEDLYSDLGRLHAKNVKVFLDACFSGATRSNDMLAEGRGVALAPKKVDLAGNLVVLSATSEDQTAWQYDREGHGLFTYFLLKKLQESQGDVTMGELSDYIADNVKKISTVVNRKRQQPSVNVSSKLGTRWRNWTVR